MGADGGAMMRMRAYCIAVASSLRFRPTTGAPMTNPAWSAAALDAARRLGDATIDPMASRILSGAHHPGAPGRLGYLRLLDLADRLLEAPELYLARDSQVRRELDALPEELRTYFDPQPVPEWVDAELLAIASQIWDENMLVIIWVLYAASLPSCYLIAKGIPALYDSGKLGKPPTPAKKDLRKLGDWLKLKKQAASNKDGNNEDDE